MQYLNRYFSIFLFSLLFLSQSCIKEKVSVKFNVSVKTDKDEPIKEAKIKLDNEIVGTTNANGVWVDKIDLPIGEQKRLEISKPSTDFYYAMDSKEFVVEEGENQIIEYQSILYSVPKPSKNAELTDQSDLGETEAVKQATETETIVKNEEIVESSKEKSDFDLSKAEVKEVKNQEMPTSNTESKNTEKNIAEEDFDPETKALPVHPIEQMLEQTKVVQEPVKELAFIHTIFVKSSGQNLANAQVFQGEDGKMELACTTNARGRCVLRFEGDPKKTMSLMVQKDGYVTARKDTRLKNKGITNFNLLTGETIDIFALTKSYNFENGLKGIEVFVNQKKIGVTDIYGRLSYVFQGNKGDFIDVTLKNKGYLPEVYQTDFVVSGPMTLKKYFMPFNPAAARVSVLPIQLAGKAVTQIQPEQMQKINDMIDSAMKQHLFSNSAFSNYPESSLTREMKSENLTTGQMLTRGWRNTSINSKLNGIVIPNMILSDEPSLELSLVDSNGIIIAAGKERLESIEDLVSVNHAVASIVGKILRKFPFEGSVLKKDKNNIHLNLGAQSGRQVKTGDRVDIWGTQSGKKGFTKEFQKIATLNIIEVHNDYSVAKILSLEPRATIERGDQVILLQSTEKKKVNVAKHENSYLSVFGKSSQTKMEAVANANVYFNGTWVGSTTETGRIYVDDLGLGGVGVIKVIKSGYSVYTEKMDLNNKTKNIILNQETAFVRLESIPANALVKIDGKIIGKTPIAYPVPIPSGFVKLELSGIPGYKDFSQVLELDQGTLELAGPRAVKLEKDYLSIADDMVQSRRYQLAIEKLISVPKEHSDYLIANHKIGEIYLTQLNIPSMAAAAFNKVTTDPSVSSFNDKRFIGTFINEGIALNKTADKLSEENAEAAIAHYSKAIETFEKVSPFMRFVPKEQYEIANLNLGFYTAISYQKLWKLTQNVEYLSNANRAWTVYLDQNEKNSNEKLSNSFIKNAKVYLRQTESLLKKAETKL